MLDQIRRITELGKRKNVSTEDTDLVPAGLRRNVRGNFVGALERMTGDLALEGWVINVDDPAKPVDLWIVINGRKSRKVRTEINRLDVQSIIPGAANCGFRVSVAHHFDLSRPSEALSLGVYLDESLGLELPGSPLEVDLSAAQTPEGLLDKLGDLAREGFHRFSPSNPFVAFFLSRLDGPEPSKRHALLKECALTEDLLELMLVHLVQRGWYAIARRMLDDCRELDGIGDDTQLSLLAQVITFKEAIHGAEVAHLVRPDLNPLTLQIMQLVTAPISNRTKNTLCADYLRLVEGALGRGFLSRQECHFLGAQLDNLGTKHPDLEQNVQYLCVKANLARASGQNDRAYTLFSDAYRIDEGAALWHGPTFAVLLNDVGEYGYAASLFKKLRDRRIAFPESVFAAFSGAVMLEDYKSVLGVFRDYSRLLMNSRFAPNILTALDSLCRKAGFRDSFFTTYGERIFSLMTRQRLVEELEECLAISGGTLGKGGSLWPELSIPATERVSSSTEHPSVVIKHLLLLDDLDVHRLIGAVDVPLSRPGQMPALGDGSCGGAAMSPRTRAALRSVYWARNGEPAGPAASREEGAIRGTYTIVQVSPGGDQRATPLREFAARKTHALWSLSHYILLSDDGAVDVVAKRTLFDWPEHNEPDALVRLLDALGSLGTQQFLFIDKDRRILNEEALVALVVQASEGPIELEGSTPDSSVPDSSLLLSLGALHSIRAHFASGMVHDERDASIGHWWQGNAEEFLASLVCFARRLGARRLARTQTTTYIRDCDAPAELTRELDKLRSDLTLHNIQMPLADSPRGADSPLEFFTEARVASAEVLNVRGVGLLRLRTARCEIDPDEPVCFIVERNELLRLPYLLTFYRQRGVRRFVVIDNFSTPETLDFLSAHDDVELWVTQHPYGLSRWGVDWVEAIIETFYAGHWCLVVDADELLYTAVENEAIPDLCRTLDQEGSSALYCLFLDTYSDRSIADTVYEPGTEFLSCCNYIDRKFYTYYEPNGGPEKNSPTYSGGVRERVFGISTVILNKVPLFKYSRHLRLYEGLHWIGGVKLSRRRAALLHFKYFSSFHEYVAQESLRGEHWNEGSEYKTYQQVIARNRALTLHDPRISVRVTGSADLQALHLVT